MCLNSFDLLGVMPYGAWLFDTDSGRYDAGSSLCSLRGKSTHSKKILRSRRARMSTTSVQQNIRCRSATPSSTDPLDEIRHQSRRYPRTGLLRLVEGLSPINASVTSPVKTFFRTLGFGYFSATPKGVTTCWKVAKGAIASARRVLFVSH